MKKMATLSRVTRQSELYKGSRRASDRLQVIAGRLNRILIALCIAVSLGSPTSVYAATITVNTTADELNSDGNCSLREAIQAANTDTAVDACTAGSGADTIVVPAGTYTLSIPPGAVVEDKLPLSQINLIGDLDITSDLTIEGAGAATTIIDGAHLDRVFHIRLGGLTVGIAGVTIQNGETGSQGGNTISGGGITNPSGTLTLTDTTVRGNKALYGGGITNGGSLTLINTTVSGNTATNNGGGIYNGGSLTLINTTVSGNTATNNGGGIGYIGGSLTNVTLTGNTASNGGGLWLAFGGTATLKNTIVANSTGGDCAGGITSAGHNLSSDGSCSLTASGDLNNTDPLLGPLADNGGPTKTHALLPGSPAIDAGSSDCPPPFTDQRGVARPQGAACDIGAYELVAVVTDVTAPVVNVSISSPNGQNGWFVTSPVIGSVTTDDTTTGGSNITAINCTGATVGSITGLGAPSASASLTVSGEGVNNVNCTATDSAGNSGAGPGSNNMATVQIDSFSPTILITSPTDGGTYTLNAAVASGYSCDDGTSEVATCAGPVTSGANFSTSPVGAHAFTVNATDVAGNPAQATNIYNVIYNFSGFFQPVDNPGPGPTFVFNVAKAGSAIPVKFSLSGNQGLNIFDTGFPVSQQITCDASSTQDVIEQTVTAGSSSLSYDATTDQYVYVWKTNKGWANTCRQLIVQLNDGTPHVAYFTFTK